MHRLLHGWLLIVATALAACSPDHAAGQRLVLTGSSTVAPLAAEIGRRFEAAHRGVRIEVQTGGSGRGIADARSGVAALGMVSRALAPDERDLTAWPIAQDEIGMIVHRDNPIGELTRDQVRRIYTGEIRTWRELDPRGADATIVVVHKAAGRATLRVFLEYLGLDAERIRAAIVVGDNEQGIKTVAGNELALGYVSLGAAERQAATGASIRALRLGAPGARPSRPLNLVTLGPPGRCAELFLDFAQSPEVHDLIRALSFTPSEL